MSEVSKKDKKRIIINNLYEAFTKYKQALVVKLDNVSSNQIQQARLALRQQKKGIMIVGKNVSFPSPFLTPLRQSSPRPSPSLPRLPRKARRDSILERIGTLTTPTFTSSKTYSRERSASSSPMPPSSKSDPSSKTTRSQLLPRSEWLPPSTSLFTPAPPVWIPLKSLSSTP